MSGARYGEARHRLRIAAYLRGTVKRQPSAWMQPPVSSTFPCHDHHMAEVPLASQLTPPSLPRPLPARRNRAQDLLPLNLRHPPTRGFAAIRCGEGEPTIREDRHVRLHHPPPHVVRLAHQPPALVPEVAQEVGCGPLVTSRRSRGPAGDAGAVGARWCPGPLRVTQRLDDPGSPKEGHLTDHRRGILTGEVTPVRWTELL